MRKLTSILAAGAIALALTGCGGDSGKGDLGSGSGGTSSGGTSSGSGTNTYSIGNGTGSSFQSGVIGLSSTNLSAGGSASITISIVNQAGTLDNTTGGVTVTLNSPCVASGLSTISATAGGTAVTSISTSTGIVDAVYTANGCSGSDVITATATVGSQTLTATGTVTVAAATVGSIQFVSATPASITLKGVGSSNGGSTSTVIFKVLNTSGGPVVGASVSFSLSTTVGGLAIQPQTATSDSTGEVQTVVSSGTVAASVRVTASTVANGTTITTQSNALTVSTGIPTSNNISLAVKCQNVEAWDYDGVSVPVTVSMTDRFSNPVPDGTTANFQSTLSGIQASCQTAGGTGACSVNWVSKAPYSISGNPQSTSGNANASTGYCSTQVSALVSAGGLPATLCNTTTNGRSPILVTAIGEESFKDATGSGYFNPGDTVAWNAPDADNNFTTGTNAGQPKPWQDTSEPFLNEWELFDQYGTPTYVLGEPYLDFNSNGTRDGPDGLVESALCQGPLCNTTETSVAIGTSNVVILSGSHPNFLVLGSTNGVVGNAYKVGGGTTLAVEIFDDRGQQMPNGTTIAQSISSGSTISITSPAPAAWPCSTAGPYVATTGPFTGQYIAGQIFNITLSNGTTTTPVAGNLNITVTTPRGLVTSVGIPLVP